MTKKIPTNDTRSHVGYYPERGRAWPLLLALQVALVLALLLFGARPAHAATFTVNSGSDAVDANIGNGTCATATGSCTLRAAVQEANALAGADAINFSTSSVTLSIAGRSEEASATGDLDITQDVTIDGGSGVTISADANFNDRIFNVVHGVPLKTATIKNVTVTGGREIRGGGINVGANSVLNLTDSTVRNNGVSDPANNPSGGGIYSDGTLMITRSTVSDNFSESSGPVTAYGGGISVNSGTATLTDSTISGNESSAFGGGEGGGIMNAGALTMTNVTVANNFSIFGANFRNYVASSGATYGDATFKNTVVAQPVATENCAIGSDTTTQGNNLSSDASCGFTGTGDIQNQDPKLGPLQNNGGPTQTHALLSGSPAVEAGTNTGCSSTDQRGITRPQDGNNDGIAVCDIGAVEVDNTAPSTNITSGPSGTVSSTSATFEFSSNEAGSTFQCKLDGAASFQSCSSPKAYTNLANGSHTFQVKAVDAAGNEDATPATRTWTVDTTTDKTPPNTTITSGPSGTVSSTSASFGFSSSESGSTFQCKLDGGTFGACTSPKSYTGLANGSHTFSVRARDSADNVDPTPATRTWTIDTTAPTGGGAWAWGANPWGQLGDGTNTKRLTPVKVVGLTGIVDISGSIFHSLAVKSDGTAWAWGDGQAGKLGDGDLNGASSNKPVQVKGPNGSGFLTNVKAVSAGHDFSLALKNDGTVWGWGLNLDWQLGDGSSHSSIRLTPIQVRDEADQGFLTGVTDIASGGAHSLAVKSDGTVRAWGANNDGQVGSGSSNTTHFTPVQVSGLTNVKAVAGGAFHSLALKNDGTVWAWGYNAEGQLGDGTNTSWSTPVKVGGLSNVVAISADGSGNHSMALKSDGTVWAWGENGAGRLGDGTTTDRNKPVKVTGLTGIKAISAGTGHSMAAKSDGTVWTWGSNVDGELGDGTENNSRPTPGKVKNLTDAKAVEAGGHSLALRIDTTPPKVLKTNPLAGAKGVSPRTNVTAVFSEAMSANTVRNPTSMRSKTFTLRRAGTTTRLAAEVTYDPATRRAVLDPLADLSLGTTYIAAVTTGAKDLAGNALDQNPATTGNQAKVWKFTVR